MQRVSVSYLVFLFFGILPVSVIYTSLAGSSLWPALIIGSICYTVCFISNLILSEVILRAFKNFSVKSSLTASAIYPLMNLFFLIPGLYLGYGFMFYLTGDQQYLRPHNTGIAVGISCIFLALAFNVHNFFKERERAMLLEKNSLTLNLMQAKLKTLTLQMNPHFLFNTLNMLVSYCSSQPKKAENIALNLSGLLRSVLKASEKEFHPVAAEMEICHLYLSLQKERFAGIRYKEAVSDDLMQQKIPPVILQPLLENALQYGTGEMALTISPDQSMIRILVENQMDGKNINSKGAGMALDNIEKRLRLSYGTRASFCIVKSELSFVVELKIPLSGGHVANTDR